MAFAEFFFFLKTFTFNLAFLNILTDEIEVP